MCRSEAFISTISVGRARRSRRVGPRGRRRGRGRRSRRGGAAAGAAPPRRTRVEPAAALGPGGIGPTPGISSAIPRVPRPGAASVRRASPAPALLDRRPASAGPCTSRSPARSRSRSGDRGQPQLAAAGLDRACSSRSSDIRISPPSARVTRRLWTRWWRPSRQGQEGRAGSGSRARALVLGHVDAQVALQPARPALDGHAAARRAPAPACPRPAAGPRRHRDQPRPCSGARARPPRPAGTGRTAPAR